jgi:hypothetical protein
MPDSPTMVFNLVYAGTLGIGFLMFLGHLGAFMVLLASAAIAKLLTNVLRALIRRLPKPAPHRQLRGRHFSRGWADGHETSNA